MDTTQSDSVRGRIPFTELPGGKDLVAFGGDLGVDRLLRMYRIGVFPWYEEGSPILWWSPDPRAVLELDALRVPRRLGRTLRSGRLRCTFDRDFGAVIRGCAGEREGETWITGEMIEGYVRLHALGHAHSVEVWEEDRLVGGLYGVSQGGFFSGESKFYRVRDASKVALVALVERLRARGFVLLDLQILNDHTRRLGGTEIPREVYLERLRRALALNVTFV